MIIKFLNVKKFIMEDNIYYFIVEIGDVI
jgi:hypothetical protein